MEKYEPVKQELEILDFWKENKIHEKAKEKNKGKKQFYFLDGPPYTSGKVHLGTAWNKVLKDSVLRYKRMRGLDVWDRAGYDMHGMDFENAYKSVDNTYMEGEWWLIKKAHENKRLYEGQKTMHWCARCATSLAKHELEYKEVKDDSIFVKFLVRDKKNEFLIVWTTTPWTIPFNLGVMVHPDFDYVKVKVDNEVWIVAKALAGPLINGV